MNKQDFLKMATGILERKFNNLENLSNVQEIDPSTTALIIIDMVNGFAKEGLLYSPRIKSLINEVLRITNYCLEKDLPVIAFADCHKEDSPELKRYGTHCLKDTTESKLIDELSDPRIILIEKNSTNGFIEPQFQEWLRKNSNIKTFIVVGDCTDICIEQFSITAAADFDRRNIEGEVIVLTKAVDTFDIPGIHEGDYSHIMALLKMGDNGVRLALSIEGV